MASEEAVGKEVPPSALLSAGKEVPPSAVPYASCFCEENVYQLCLVLQRERIDLDSAYVVFISSRARNFPLWKQKVLPAQPTSVPLPPLLVPFLPHSPPPRFRCTPF